LAGDQIAGAGTAAAAVNAVTDLRKSRRFIKASQDWRVVGFWTTTASGVPSRSRRDAAEQKARFRGFIGAILL
jgi:hypothetical protein